MSTKLKEHLTKGQHKVDLLLAHMERLNAGKWTSVPSKMGEKSPLPRENVIVGGFYIGTMFLPAGMLAVGEILKVDSMFFIRKGRGLLYRPEHSDSVVIAEGFTKFCPAGGRKVITALEDITMVAMFPVDDTVTLENAEDFCVAKSFDDPQLLVNAGVHHKELL